jgi:hypothetical protein
VGLVELIILHSVTEELQVDCRLYLNTINKVNMCSRFFLEKLTVIYIIKIFLLV